MNRFSLSLAVFILTAPLALFSQISISETPRIQVTGSAEMEVEPDEIKTTITIQEYYKEEYIKGKDYKDYVTLVPLDEIDANFRKTLKEVGVKDEQIYFDTFSNFYWWRPKEKKSKTYVLDVTDLKLLDKALKAIDGRYVSSINIAKNRSDIEEIRRKVKIQATKAAKEKAADMADAVGAKLGGVLLIQEEASSSPGFYSIGREIYSNARMESAPSSNEIHATKINKMKIRYEISATFELISE